MSEMLPELISSIMREDTSAVSKGLISVPQFWALHYIAKDEGLSVNALAAALNRGKSSTSTLLQRLEKDGLVRRQRSTIDQRVVNIHLTPKGRRLVQKLAEDRKHGIRKTYSALSAEERTRHLHMVEKIVQNARKAALLLIAALLLPAAARAQTPAHTYTLDESIRIGLERSLSIANAARQREIAEARRTGAISEALPKLVGIANYARNFPDEINGYENPSGRESTQFGAEAYWPIFSGGKTLSALRASKVYRLLTLRQERRVQADQIKNIALAYYQVQLATERVAALSNSVHQLAEFEAETQLKYEAGTVSEFDWLSARVSLANEKPRLISAENVLSIALESFRNLTFIDDEQLTLSDPLEYKPVEVDLDKAITLGLEKNPDLQEKSSAVALLRENIYQQKSDYYPAVDLYANYTYVNPNPYGFFLGDDGWQYGLSTGVRATWNLFDGGRRRANVAESKLNHMIAEDEYRDLERYIALDVKTAWLRARDAAEVISATAENVALAERALDIARSRFDAGLGTNLEVTQANVELSNAQLARAQALYEHMAAVTQMKYAVGILLEEFDDEPE